MNELLSDPRLSLALWVLLMSVFSFLAKRLYDRVDDHAKHHVSRDELAKTMTQLRDDRLRMHEENREDLAYIRLRVDTIIDRQADQD